MTKATRALIALIRQHRLNYDTLRVASHEARKHLGITQPVRRVLPKLLPEDAVKQFFTAVESGGNVQHAILFRFLLHTAIRVEELVNVEVSHVDLTQGTVFISQGKGAKDRYTIFPTAFRLPLRTYIQSNPENRYLFESTHKTKYTARWIRYLMDHYADKAGVSENMHPHLFRHFCLTHLTREGLTDAQIQIISGHKSKDSLAVYQHLSMRDVAPSYQTAMQKMKLD